MEELKSLQEEYKTLAKVDNVKGTWGVKKLTAEIALLKGDKPPFVPNLKSEDSRIKGNMTHALEDGHPAKTYSFKDGIAAKGFVPEANVSVSQYYHLWLVPHNGNPREDSARKPYRTVMSPVEYQGFAKGKISYTYPFDEVTILHDPTK